MEHKAPQRNPFQSDFSGGTECPAVLQGTLGPSCCRTRRDVGPKGPCAVRCHRLHRPWGSAAEISKGKSNDLEPSQQPAGIPWDGRDPAGRPICWACRHLPSHGAKKQVAKSQQNHESKTTEPQSASESLPRPPPRPHSPPKLAATCSQSQTAEPRLACRRGTARHGTHQAAIWVLAASSKRQRPPAHAGRGTSSNRQLTGGGAEGRAERQ